MAPATKTILKVEKQYFNLEHNGKTYKCWLDERGEVWYYDAKGNPTSAVHHRPITSMEEAKRVALEIIVSHGY